jgi:hypothetical protein
MEILHQTTKFNGNTPTLHQNLLEILQHIPKRLMKILQHTNKVSISIKLWWFGGVFQLNFGGLVEYFN